MLEEVVNDETTQPGLASALLTLQEVQVQNPPLTETCGNEADDDGDGLVDEDCPEGSTPLTETCGNETDDDGDGTIDEEDCVLPPTETCGNQADDDGDGTVDEEDCVLPPTETCGNQADDDGDGTVDEEDCAITIRLRLVEMEPMMMVTEQLMRKNVSFLQQKYVTIA